MMGKNSRKTMTLFVIILVSVLSIACSTPSISDLNTDRVVVEVASFGSLPDGTISYQLNLINNSSYSLKHVNVYLSYPIENSNGTKGNPFRVLADPVRGMKDILEPGETTMLTVTSPITEVFGDNEKLDFDNPYIYIHGYILDGKNEILFTKGKRYMLKR